MDLDAIGARHRAFNARRLAARMKGIRALEIHECKERRKQNVATAKICDITKKVLDADMIQPAGFTRPGVFEYRARGAGGDPAVLVTAAILSNVETIMEEGKCPTEMVMTDVHPDAAKKAVGAALAGALKTLGYRKPREKKSAPAKPGKRGEGIAEGERNAKA